MTIYNTPEDLLEEIRELRGRIERLERAPRAGSTSVDTGTWQIKNAAGTILGYIGVQPQGDIGVSFYRSSGKKALEIAGLFNGDDQLFRLYNRAGEVIGGDQAFSNNGFAGYHTTIVTEVGSNGVAVTSTSWYPTHEIETQFFNTAQTMFFRAYCSDATTAGEVRCVDEFGNQLPGFFMAIDPVVIPAGTTTWTKFDTRNNSGSNWYYISRTLGADINFQLQARRTAGTGTIYIKPRYYSQRAF